MPPGLSKQRRRDPNVLEHHVGGRDEPQADRIGTGRRHARQVHVDEERGEALLGDRVDDRDVALVPRFTWVLRPLRIQSDPSRRAAGAAGSASSEEPTPGSEIDSERSTAPPRSRQVAGPLLGGGPDEQPALALDRDLGRDQPVPADLLLDHGNTGRPPRPCRPRRRG